ncbi:hypothetical protein PRIPAC_90351 [Pristionchus pacificus]|uniref:Uncharacterized protein n=1 Tax=Pristionchus pacificus TaxID=54126 RepID=A0A2A6B5T3_PRIPA|nr:hypothetical protein PRIPAC_90351 [Pristionchus pacificus]|eukprot:PDM61232.1 hypothetical protein PRIPAC_50674 [Pristionchus pacificus]
MRVEWMRQCMRQGQFLVRDTCVRMRVVSLVAALLHVCESFDAYSANHPTETIGEEERADLQSELNALLREVHPALFFRPDTNLDILLADNELSEVSDMGDITRHELIDDSTAPIKPYQSRIEEESEKGGVEQGGTNESIIPTTTARLLVFAKKRKRPTIVFPSGN